jgi:colicin import membrane protein
MIVPSSYRKALYCALAFHLFFVFMLLSESSSKTPVLSLEAQNTPQADKHISAVPQPEVVRAVSVDNKELMETVNRLKHEQVQKQRTEQNRQKELNHQVELAKQQRIKEQQKVAQLKEEANRIAIARKKQAEEEKKHLKELAEQKVLEAKRLKELKEQEKKLAQKHEVEEKKLAELKKKNAETTAKDELKKAEQAKADKERKKQADIAAAELARQNSQRQARLSGEVDKYKALILNAIGRNWILPENVNGNLTSQFRIRLAPDGNVLEVSLMRSSGDPLLDRSAQTAIYKASPLPVPTDAETFNMFRDISLTVRPEQVRG